MTCLPEDGWSERNNYDPIDAKNVQNALDEKHRVYRV